MRLYFEEYELEYYQLPKFLWNEEVGKLSGMAIVLYALLYDRSRLSKANNWVDKEGNIYIRMTVKEIEETLKISHPTAIKLLDELEKATLIIRKKGLPGSADKIYVLVDL